MTMPLPGPSAVGKDWTGVLGLGGLRRDPTNRPFPYRAEGTVALGGMRK